MSIFEIAAEITLASEGGYSNSLSDLGGETNFGISSRRYPMLDIKNLTKEEALFLYKKAWDQYRVGEIKNQWLANQIFDMVFNMDYVKAIKCVQNALLKINISEPVVVDGIMGSTTIRLINSSDAIKLLDSIKIERIKHYLKRVTDNKSQLVNMPSWIRRTVCEYEYT